MTTPYESMDEIMKLVLSCATDHVPKDGARFADGLGPISYKSVFETLWMRQGLDRRSRSLVTLGILLALRAHDEFKIHTLIANKNGVSVEEIEEILYHATAYAGFPAVNLATRAAAEALGSAGLLEERRGPAEG